jgi:hypothetical protein
MAITRSQIARQLMQEGGVPRQGYFLGKLVKKIKDDIIPNELKSPAGVAAALTAANFAPKFIPGGSDQTLLQRFLPSVSDALGTVRESIGSGLGTARDVVTDTLGKEVGSGDNKSTIGSTLLKGILSPQALALGSGLLAGAFTKDKEDPIYTGQDVGLNLQDIAKLANISDPKTASAIGLRFSPDVESRKFTPEEMAASYAANAPVEFTEKREQAQDGGIMGDQKDFEQFLQDMKNRDTGAMQDQILRDFQEYMKRKKMIEQMPEAKDGGIMKMADGGMMDMGGMEMDLRGGGFVPMGRAEKADDVPARLSKNEFVFTADAVRAAGGGSVDKGADKMYATMKKLEDRVA